MESQISTELKTITYYVNGESQTTQHHKLTVRTILTNAGFTPAENYRLVRDAGNHTYTNLDEEVPLHEGETFTALFQGPTPTSYGNFA
jgi:hypothetical protein